MGTLMARLHLELDDAGELETLPNRGVLVVFLTTKTPYFAKSRRLSVFGTSILSFFVDNDYFLE